MQKRDLDQLMASPPGARTRRPTVESPLAPGPAEILRLQRLAGNASVSSLMVSRKPHAAAAPVAAPAVAPGQLSRGDLMFTPLPAGRGWLTGTGRNKRAHDLQIEFGHVWETYTQASGIMGFLQYAEKTMGPRELAAVDAIAPTVAKKSVGDSGASMRAAVEQYTEANPSLVAAFSEVKAGRSELIAKSEFFLKAVSEKNLTGGKREEQKAEEGVKEVQDKIDKAKKWADEILDGTFKLLSGDWKEALKDVGKFAIQELILDPITEGVYEDELSKAKKTLSDAKDKVASLEDERDLHALLGATNELQAAKDKLEAKVNALLAAARRASAAHRTLVEKLSGMGKAGAKAAAALESRQEVADNAQLGTNVLAKYQGQVVAAGGHAHLLAVAYQIYADFAASPGGENEVPNADIRQRIGTDARQNQWTSEHLEKWTKDEVGAIADAQNYIASGSYMQSYRDIDKSLAEAVANR